MTAKNAFKSPAQRSSALGLAGRIANECRAVEPFQWTEVVAVAGSRL